MFQTIILENSCKTILEKESDFIFVILIKLNGGIRWRKFKNNNCSKEGRESQNLKHYNADSRQSASDNCGH